MGCDDLMSFQLMATHPDPNSAGSRWFLEVSESQKKNIHGISWDHHSKYYLAQNQPEPAAKAFMGMSFRGLVWVEPFANLPSSL